MYCMNIGQGKGMVCEAATEALGMQTQEIHVLYSPSNLELCAHFMWVLWVLSSLGRTGHG